MELKLNNGMNLNPYKKAKPKVEDSISVIVEQIQENEKNTQILQGIHNSLDEKLEKFYQYNPRVNINDYKIENKKNLDEWKNHNQKHIDIFISTGNLLIDILQQKVNEIKVLKSEENKDISKIFFGVVLISVLSFVGTLVSLNSYENTNSTKEYQLKKDQMEAGFKQYLYDNHDEDKYIKWTKRKQ